MQHPDHKKTTQWISTIRPKHDALARLLCFSYAGAGASAYRGWADAAPATLEIHPVQLPGRESRLREPTVATLPPIVSAIADAVAALGNRPFAFFGHSLGAVVAFETARHLRRIGGPMPTTLFVSASRAPQLPWPHPPVRHLDDHALLLEVDRRYGSVPTVIRDDAELRALLTPALRADMTLIETYTYMSEAPLDCPIVAFGGHADSMVDSAAITQWTEQTSGSFRMQMVPGDHLFLQSQRQELLDVITESLGLTGPGAPQRLHSISSTP